MAQVLNYASLISQKNYLLFLSVRDILLLAELLDFFVATFQKQPVMVQVLVYFTMKSTLVPEVVIVVHLRA